MPDNLLIAALPRADRLRLLARCETVTVVRDELLAERGQPMRHLYFPLGCVLALIAQVDDHPGMALTLIGHEGMLGLHVARAPARSGAPGAPLQARVQAPGQASRIAAGDFRLLLGGSAALQHQVSRQMRLLLTSLAAAAACAHFHQIRPRLARWLLLSAARAGTDVVRLTHAELATMLGVRRVGVTVAAGLMQRDGLIGYHRGRLSLLDHAGLVAAACSCHAAELAWRAGP